MVFTNAKFSSEISNLEIENSKVALKAAREGIVLLKNDGVLPLDVTNIALYGSGSATTIKGGTGSGEVNERASKTILEGLEEVGFNVTTKKYLDEYKELLINEKHKHNDGIIGRIIKGGFANIMGAGFIYPSGRLLTLDDIKSSNTDTCIYVVARQAGESSDRELSKNMFTLDDVEINNLKLCAKEYKKVILVINVGGSMDLTPVEEIDGINAIIFFAHQGQMGGLAFAEIIKGDVSPSGCLTDTWAKKYDDIPFANEFSYLKGDDINEFYKEDIYVGYRYFDTYKVSPRYEFGYGLTYADFSCDVLEVTNNKSEVSVKVNVKNISDKYSGKKVMQLYLLPAANHFKREYQMLVAFVKTDTLKPGDVEGLSLTFDISEFALYDELSASYLLEKGDYILKVGFSSKDNCVCGVVNIDDDVIVRKCKNICPINHKMEVLEGQICNHEYSDVSVITLTKDDFTCELIDYSKYDNLEQGDELKELSTDELIALVCGGGMFGGKKYFDAFGSAGFTTSKLIKKNIVNVALADGPAGLRLQKRTSLLKNGSTKQIDPMMEFLNYLPKIVKKFMFGNPNKDRILYQYTTAFPVGMALAQTFNTSLLTEVGMAISKEMMEYGVTFWLAPGMNIHRNPLCGRNYEYYSEDPYLTGMVASSIVNGIQSNKGCYATIKHFAANNREFLRNKSDSIMTERALREIYLKGFEIAIKKSNAKSVMTSYNLLNGLYTPNSYDLCIDVLRNEWNFDGVVMSDWLSTAKGYADNGMAIKAGNDLIMPGGGYYRKQIKKALKNGNLSYEELYRCAYNVYKAVKNSRIQEQFENGTLNSIK